MQHPQRITSPCIAGLKIDDIQRRSADVAAVAINLWGSVVLAGECPAAKMAAGKNNSLRNGRVIIHRVAMQACRITPATINVKSTSTMGRSCGDDGLINHHVDRTLAIDSDQHRIHSGSPSSQVGRETNSLGEALHVHTLPSEGWEGDSTEPLDLTQAHGKPSRKGSTHGNRGCVQLHINRVGAGIRCG